MTIQNGWQSQWRQSANTRTNSALVCTSYLCWPWQPLHLYGLMRWLNSSMRHMLEKVSTVWMHCLLWHFLRAWHFLSLTFRWVGHNKLQGYFGVGWLKNKLVFMDNALTKLIAHSLPVRLITFYKVDLQLIDIDPRGEGETVPWQLFLIWSFCFFCQILKLVACLHIHKSQTLCWQSTAHFIETKLTQKVII